VAEKELFRFVENRYPEVLKEIKEKKEIADELAEKIDKILSEFKEEFKVEL